MRPRKAAAATASAVSRNGPAQLIQFGGVAIRVGACVHIPADIGKEQFVVSSPLGAIDAASGGGNKLGIALVERCLLQEQEKVMLYPMLKVPDG
jgi:hypothetical protein